MFVPRDALDAVIKRGAYVIFLPRSRKKQSLILIEV